MSSNTSTPQPVLTYEEQKEQFAKLKEAMASTIFAGLLPKVDEIEKEYDNRHGR